MTDTTRPDGVLAAYAEGRIHHLNRGLCPDEVAGHSSRDPDCPVCAALSHAKPAVGGVADEWAAFCRWYGRRHVYEYSRQAKWEAWQARAALAPQGEAK